ncbi:arginine--tRNA ligase, partial [Escherichia sp. S69_ASV_4]|nr:arginine--tRNA ligase [Escherichia sp. S69_ASV_4]
NGYSRRQRQMCIRDRQENAGEMELADLEGFYRDAKKHYDEDEEFAERARNYVVKLQSGDEYFREMWRKLVDITMTQNQITYDPVSYTHLTLPTRVAVKISMFAV